MPYKTIVAKPFKDTNNNEIIGEAFEQFNFMAYFRGVNNKLIIEEGVRLRDVSIRFDAHNATIHFRKNSQYRGTIRAGIGCNVNIGSGLTVTENCYISCAEYTSIEIGEDCMFASFNQIRTDDAHPIFDLSTGKRINESQSINIGNHVWLGFESVVLGGSEIGSGSIVGMRSLVKSTHNPNSLIVGQPAKTTKEDVAWERTHLNLMPPFNFPQPTTELKDFRKS